jgi:hypothetical protein
MESAWQEHIRGQQIDEYPVYDDDPYDCDSAARGSASASAPVRDTADTPRPSNDNTGQDHGKEHSYVPPFQGFSDEDDELVDGNVGGNHPAIAGESQSEDLLTAVWTRPTAVCARTNESQAGETPRLTIQQKRVICINKRKALKKKAEKLSKARATSKAISWDIKRADLDDVPLMTEGEKSRASFLASIGHSHEPGVADRLGTVEEIPVVAEEGGDDSGRRFHPNYGLPGWTGDKYYHVPTARRSPSVDDSQVVRTHCCSISVGNAADDDSPGLGLHNRVNNPYLNSNGYDGTATSKHTITSDSDAHIEHTHIKDIIDIDAKIFKRITNFSTVTNNQQVVNEKGEDANLEELLELQASGLKVRCRAAQPAVSAVQAAMVRLRARGAPSMALLPWSTTLLRATFSPPT